MRLDQSPRWRAAAGYTGALLTGGCVGVTWALQKVVLNQGTLGPAALNWLNMIGLCLIVWPAYLTRFRGRAFGRGQPYAWLAVFALIASSIFYLRNVGVMLTGPTTSAVVTRSEVAFVFLLSYLVLRQPVSALGWLGTAMLLAGALWTAGLGSAELTCSALGIAALVGSALGVALNALIIKAYFSRLPNELVILASGTVQVMLFSVVVPATGGLHEAREALRQPHLLGLVGLGSAFIFGQLFFYYYAMKRAPMWAVRILALTGVPAATLLDHYLLQARVTSAQLQGLVAALAGAVLVILSGRQHADAGDTAVGARPAACEEADSDGR